MTSPPVTALGASVAEARAGDEALVRAGVESPASFRRHAATLMERLPGDGPGRAALATALVLAARPDAAARTLAELAADPEPGIDPAAPGAPALARVLGGADFLARRAARMPEPLAEICAAEQLAPRTEATARARVAGLAEASTLDAVRRGLRRNRYEEYLRLTARALSGAPSGETTRELSDLADASIDAAVRAASRAHGVPGQLCAIAMGKLGGREVNYSSDVDLIFVHDDGASDGAALGRTVAAVRSLLSETSEDGFVFRVDLDLRPEGRSGPPVSPAGALVDFYESFGRTWERVAWIRARACAGRRELGARVIAELVPFVFRRYGSFDVVRNVRDVKARIESDARDAERNVKLGRGGIREAEFVVQALQSLYGGRHPELRRPNTSEALAGLAELELLEPARARALADDYAFLRRLENGLQMAEDRQVQDLPEDEAGRRRLARRLGYDHADGKRAAALLLDDLESVRERVRSAFDALLVEKRDRSAHRTPEAADWLQACQQPKTFVTALLEAAPEGLAERCRPAAERLAATAFGRGGEGAAALEHAPEAAPALALLLAADPELSGHLTAHPSLLDGFAESEAPFPESEPPAADGDLESALDALRTMRRDAFVLVAARRLRGGLHEDTLRAALSDAARRVLAAGLELAFRHAGRGGDPEARPARMCVLGMGKLGSREMTFQSDLDLVFLYEPRGGEAPLAAQEWAARVAQRLIHYLTTPTTLGRAYEVDTRLRPSGHGGALVASLDSFRHYHERRAQIWEAQALLRASPVAGDAAFGEQAMTAVQGALFEFLSYPQLEDEIRRMRGRIENELGRASEERIDLKNAAGGMIDAEFLAQYLALREGPRRPELRNGSTPRLLEAAGRLGLLRDAPDALGALEVLRRVETAVRLASGRSDSVLDLAGPLAPLVAAVTGDGDVATLAESVRQAQKRLRELFARELRL